MYTPIHTHSRYKNPAPTDQSNVTPADLTTTKILQPTHDNEILPNACCDIPKHLIYYTYKCVHTYIGNIPNETN